MEGDFRAGQWLVQPQLNIISNTEEVVKLEPKVMEVLLCLAEQAGEVISKERLIQTVWADRFVTDEVLTTAVFELRKALRDEARNPRFIQTVPKRGYRFIAPISFDTPASLSPTEATLSDQKDIPPIKTSNVRWILATGALTALLILLLITFSTGDWWRGIKGKTVVPFRSVAVLPIKDLSVEQPHNTFADSITEALITDLARLTPLRVVSRTSVMPYRNSNQSTTDIARALGVDTIVEGSIFRAGDRVRITVQLIDASNDQHLWAESYERDGRDLLALQGEVARIIAEEIRANLALKERAIHSATRSISVEAREVYLKGRELWNRRTEEGLNKSLAQFEHATGLDPGYAEAYAGIADAYVMLVNHNHLRPEDAYPKAKAAALRAVQLDATLAESHASLGLVKLVCDWDLSGAEQEFKRAISLNPDYASARMWYSWHLWAAGHLDEALKEIRRAQELDPGSLALHLTAGDILFRLNRQDEAVEAYSKVLDINPSYMLAYKALGHCYHKKGMEREAGAAYTKAIELSGTVTFDELSKNFVWWSKSNDQRYLLNKMSVLLKQKYVRSSHIARIYLDLGERDRAFEWLERAYKERDVNLLFLRTEEGWNPIRHDPRFSNLVDRIGSAGLLSANN